MILRPLTTAEEWMWFKERTHVILCEDMCGIVAYQGADVVAAGVLDSFTVHSCNAHLAIDKPIVLRHGFIEAIAETAFITHNRKYIFGLVPDRNEKALKLDKHLGFYEVARVPDAVAEGVGYVVLRMDKEDCRWLPKQEEAA